jgi:hypothetical protein
VSGLLAGPIGGVATAVLRAPVPLDRPMRLTASEEGVRLTSLDGAVLIGEARPGDLADLPQPPAPPSLEAAQAAAPTFVGLKRPFHPVCFTCGVLDEGYGCRVFAGQVEGAPAGHVASPWTPHVNFADEDGLTRLEVVWAALDCPGSVSWVVQEGGGGLLGTMTCEVVRRPRADEACIVTAWPIERSGRKSLSGTALFTAEGELLARSRQIWIGRAPTPPE